MFMQTNSLHTLRLGLAGAAALITHVTLAQTWQTVDDFQYTAGKNAFATGLAKDPAGNIYAAGDAQDAGGAWHAVAMKSGPGGTTWAPIDDYSYLNSGYDAGIVCDAVGNLYGAGYNGPFPDGKTHWFVRRSVDGGLSWSTVDDFAFGRYTNPRALTTDSAGNVYVVGQGTVVVSGNPSTNYWVVRKGTPGGDGSISWSTVDTFLVPNAYQHYANASGCFAHPTAGLFVVGSAEGGGRKGDVAQWVVRRSLDGGTTWATVDAYQLDSTAGAAAYGAGADASGNIYAVGHAVQTIKGATSDHWIVRKSTNGGTSWATVDNFIGSSSQAIARGFAADSSGNLFVIGNVGHWLVRKNPGGVGTWVTVDDFQNATGQALLSDSSGDVFGAGYGSDAAGVEHWIVRKGTP